MTLNSFSGLRPDVSRRSQSLPNILILPHAVVNAWRRPWADVGIIVGTAVTRVVLPWRDDGAEAPSYIAVDPVANRVVALGDEARLMEGRAPAPIRVLHPFSHSVVGDFEAASQFIKTLMRRAAHGIHLTGTRAVVAVPSDATPLECNSLREAVQAAGARSVHLVDQALASALGAGVSLDEARGAMVVQVGAGTTQIAVSGLGGVVYREGCRTGGAAMDLAIVTWLKRHRQLWVGERAAEELKQNIGSAVLMDSPLCARIGGRDLSTGSPRLITVTSNEICEALQPVLDQIIEPVLQGIARLSAPMLADIMRDGIHLTGGAAQLRGFAEYVAARAHVAAQVADHADGCVAAGVRRMLEDKHLLRLGLVRNVLTPEVAAVTNHQTHVTVTRGRAPQTRLLAVGAPLVVLLTFLVGWLLLGPGLTTTASSGADTPMESALAPSMTGAYARLQSLGHSLQALWQGAQDNDALRDRAALLDLQLADTRRESAALEHRNRELSALLHVPVPNASKGVVASVVMRDPTGWLSSVVVNRGTRDGVRPGMSAMRADGLLGQVVWAGPTSSRVRLLTGPNTVVACRVMRPHLPPVSGILYGVGEPQCVLRFLDPDATLRVGDRVVTSGQDGMVAPGVPVGRITQVLPVRDTVYRAANVKPAISASIASAVLLLPHP